MGGGKRKLASSTLGYGQGTPFIGGPADVVVIGRNVLLREQVREDLEGLGYKVHSVVNHEGLARLSRKATPRLLIANVSMGDGLLIGYWLADFGEGAPALLLLSDDEDPPPFEGVTAFLPTNDVSKVIEVADEILKQSAPE